MALGRALIRRPKLFLMDEPLSNLDAKLRLQMRTEIKRLHRELPVTTMYVTHDQSEAMALSDRVVVMNHGAVAQVDTPDGIYWRPARSVRGRVRRRAGDEPAAGVADDFGEHGALRAGRRIDRRHGHGARSRCGQKQACWASAPNT